MTGVNVPTVAELQSVLKLEPYIDGLRRPAVGTETYNSCNPSNNELLAQLTLSGEEDIARAVASARAAFDCGPWPRFSAAERQKKLSRFADAIEANAAFLGSVESYDVGKLLAECIGHDVARASANIRFFSDLATQWQDDAFSSEAAFLGRKLKTLTIVKRQPVGVAALIVPWNSPLMLATWKIGPCLAAGNTCVVKPSPWASLSILQLGELAAEAGIPNGVLNIVAAGVRGGQALVSHPQVDRVSFTGSVATGRAVHQANAAVRLAPISLELGGKAPCVVFEDAELEFAALGVARGMYRSQGQSCVAGSRLLLQETVYEQFMKALTEVVAKMKIGSQLDSNTEIGPLVTQEHLLRVEDCIAKGKQEGARLVFGGFRPTDAALQHGNFLVPTIFDQVQSTMQLWQEETFGPVLSVISFRDEAEAVSLANDTAYGLSSSVWTKDLERALRVSQAIDSGMTWVNSHFLRDLRAPFGGFKNSGIGSEGGKYSLEFYTKPKMICLPYPS